MSSDGDSLNYINNEKLSSLFGNFEYIDKNNIEEYFDLKSLKSVNNFIEAQQWIESKLKDRYNSYKKIIKSRFSNEMIDDRKFQQSIKNLLPEPYLRNAHNRFMLMLIKFNEQLNSDDNPKLNNIFVSLNSNDQDNKNIQEFNIDGQFQFIVKNKDIVEEINRNKLKLHSNHLIIDEEKTNEHKLCNLKCGIVT